MWKKLLDLISVQVAMPRVVVISLDTLTGAVLRQLFLYRCRRLGLYHSARGIAVAVQVFSSGHRYCCHGGLASRPR